MKDYKDLIERVVNRLEQNNGWSISEKLKKDLIEVLALEDSWLPDEKITVYIGVGPDTKGTKTIMLDYAQNPDKDFKPDCYFPNDTHRLCVELSVPFYRSET